MINTDYTTFSATFKNTSTIFIFNTQKSSIENFVHNVKAREITIKEFKEFSHKDQRFKRTNKSFVRRCCNHVIDFELLLDKHGF